MLWISGSLRLSTKLPPSLGMCCYGHSSATGCCQFTLSPVCVSVCWCHCVFHISGIVARTGLKCALSCCALGLTQPSSTATQRRLSIWLLPMNSSRESNVSNATAPHSPPTPKLLTLHYCSVDEYKGHMHLEYAHRGEVSKLKKSLSSKLVNFQHPQTQDSPLVGELKLVLCLACGLLCVVMGGCGFSCSTKLSCPPPQRESKQWKFCFVKAAILT